MSKNSSTTDNAADGAHARLRDAILSGALRPNLRLVETDLAAELGMSRTPVREALLRLRQEGLVSQDRGWVVRDHDPAEVLEYFEARAAVESAAACLAAQRIDPDSLAALHSLVEQMEDPELSRREINALNSTFHTTITAASGNSVLTGFARNTAINYWTFATPVVFTEADDQRVNAEHRALVSALESGDSARASQVAHDHVAATTAIIARALGINRP